MKKSKKNSLIALNLGIAIFAPISIASVMHQPKEDQQSSLQTKAIQEGEVFYAHRGYNSKYPENTEMSYQGAADAGFNGVETDIHLTKDGIPVLLHDDTIDRTVKGGYKGAVNSYTLAELKEFDFSNGYDVEPQRILTLEEFSSKFDSQFTHFNHEIKGTTSGIEQKVWDVIQKYLEGNNWMIQSFNANTVRNVSNLDKGIRVGYLVGSFNDLENSNILEYITDLNPSYGAVESDPEYFTNILNNYGLNTSVWTLNTKSAYETLIATANEYGFDPDFISDYALFNGDFGG